ncbi:MAG: fused MFS/spermidine synthase [Verrucomicrobia bacterium]|nr:fused MFS/spermidine synthase [Verrucomicrobiota bacterium]MCH8510667.1 fused MFS/spermidine synthase [Kiritimatiellia bacterium]
MNTSAPTDPIPPPTDPRNPKSARQLISVLCFFSGALALAQQLLWTRRMVDLLGASAGSAARVVGCFFLGLALGAAGGALLAAKTHRPWWWTGMAELGIALLCLPMVFLPWWADGLWPWLGPDRLLGWQGGSLKTLLSVLLVLPPASMMGFFLPLAVAGWPGGASRRDPEPHQDPGLWLYALNTLGAVAGVFLTMGPLLRHFGMIGAMMAVIVGNVISALCYFLLDRKHRPETAPQPETQPRTIGRPPTRFLWISALSGALVIGVEIIAMTAIQWVAPLSFFAPGAILGVFIALLAISAFAVETGLMGRAPHENLLVAVALASGVLLALAPLLFHVFAPLFPAGAPSASMGFFAVKLGLFSLGVFGPAVLAAGLWFPLVAAISGAEADSSARLRWGWLLAANGLGGLLGAELTLRVLMPAFGPFPAMGLLGFAYLIAAWVMSPPKAPIQMKAAIWGSIGLVTLLMNTLLPTLPTVNPAFANRVVDESHGREGSFAILDAPAMGRAILMQNQYVLGSSRAVYEQERQAHLPLLLHPAPQRVGFIGAGTGISPGGALAHEAVAELTAAEISSAVVRAAAQWFHVENRGISTHPTARIVVEDGRTWVAAHRDHFDVLVSDLFLPWGPGEGRLYTREHFTAARESLRSDGLFCLWLPLYQLTEPQLQLILDTFLDVFGEALIVKRESSDVSPVLGLLAWKDAPPETSALLQTLEIRMAADGHRLEDPEMNRVEAVQALWLGRVRQEGTPPVNTLGNLAVELQAGRTRILDGENAPYLVGQRLKTWRENMEFSNRQFKQ